MVSSEEIKRRLEEKRKNDIRSLEKETAPDVEKTTPDNVEEITTEDPSETLKYCSNCDVEFEEEANFCPKCGSPLEAVSSTDEAELIEESEDEYVDEDSKEISEDEYIEEEPDEELFEETAEYEEEPVEELVEEPIEEEAVKSKFDSKSMPYTPSTITGDITVVTTNFVPGYHSVETLGFVYGLTVRSRGLGGQIGAGVRSMFGGEIKEYVKMMENARQEALSRMIDHAREMGANAVISARFDSDAISEMMQEILAYGTAVIIEEDDE